MGWGSATRWGPGCWRLCRCVVRGGGGGSWERQQEEDLVFLLSPSSPSSVPSGRTLRKLLGLQPWCPHPVAEPRGWVWSPGRPLAPGAGLWVQPSLVPAPCSGTVAHWRQVQALPFIRSRSAVDIPHTYSLAHLLASPKWGASGALWSPRRSPLQQASIQPEPGKLTAPDGGGGGASPSV